MLGLATPTSYFRTATPFNFALAIAADKLAHELGVDEEFLDELVAGL